MLSHSFEDVVVRIAEAMKTVRGPVAVMAGHFALVEDTETGELVAGVHADIQNATLRQFVMRHPYMGEFPAETWRAGIEVVKRLSAMEREARLVVLVNDWQHVPAASHGQPHVHRDEYYRHAELPRSMRQALVTAGFDDAALLWSSRHGSRVPMWSESTLRARYHRHHRERVRIESPCAQEWAPLMICLGELGYGGLVGFVPPTCRVAIEGGSEIVQDELELELKTTIVTPMGDDSNFWATTMVTSV